MKKLNIILSILSMILLGVGSAILGTSGFLSSPTKDGEVNVVSTAPIISPKEEPVEEITYTYKAYEDYFTDLDFSNITLTGTGTEKDPFQVNSTEDFLYLLKNYALTNKYVELHSDIILNDETFDENGNPSGGDGKIYSWVPYSSCKNLSVYGNGYTIFGLYVNDITASNIGLFLGSGANSLKTIQDLDMRNLYLNVKSHAFSFCFQAESIINCNTYSGTINLQSSCAGGIAFYAKGLIKNCNNYINIISNTGGSIGGIFCSAVTDGKIINSNNHGKLSGKMKIGGICVEKLTNYKFENCTNFGEVYSESYYAGGILAESYSTIGETIITNCKSYGDVYGTYGHYGGLIGWCEGRVTVENCIVDCVVDSLSSGYRYMTALCFGSLRNQYVTIETKATIKNCTFVVNGSFPFIGDHYEHRVGNRISVDAEDLTFKIQKRCPWYYRMFNKATKVDTNLKNIYIEINDESVTKFRLVDGFSDSNDGSYNIKNVLIKSKAENLQAKLFDERSNQNGNNIFADGIVLINSANNQNYYYGDDFFNFYVSWRTGRLGLVSMDGRGFFQGKVDKEWFVKEGYNKLAK